MEKLNKLFWDFISLFGTLGAGLLVVILGFILDIQLGLHLLIDLVVITAVSNTIKYFHFKPRPDNPEGIRPTIDFHVLDVRKYLSFRHGLKNIWHAFEHVDAGSFPSIHSARSMNQAILLAVFLSGILWAQIALIAFAAIVGWSRWVKRRHFKFDIASGFVLGSLIAALSLWISPLL